MNPYTEPVVMRGKVIGYQTRTMVPVGTRVKLREPSIFGWSGTATVLALDGFAIKDDYRDGDVPGDTLEFVGANPGEWVDLDDQTPNPNHRRFLQLVRDHRRTSPMKLLRKLFTRMRWERRRAAAAERRAAAEARRVARMAGGRR